MDTNVILLLPVLVPIVMGVLVLTVKGIRKKRKVLVGLVAGTLAAGVILTIAALSAGGRITLWHMMDDISIPFHDEGNRGLSITLAVDGVSRLFAALTSAVWFLVGIYSISYMTHERDEYRFFGFYLIVLGVLIALDFSANLVTFYVFYEMMTLTSLPLVLHEMTKDAVMAGLKYLFYSVAGAFLALFGIFFLYSVTESLDFIPGGVAMGASLAGNEGMLLAAVCCMLVGFGTKAGMFPLHGWLPTAHPVAPAPASAVLSGLITKAGVLGLLRVTYYIVGPDRLRGTWVQSVWMFLSLLTVFMGSMLAYKEPVLKKRLAYSTVSQVSYIIFGLGLFNTAGFVGTLSHVVFHCLVKNALFLAAGAIIFKTGWTRADQMRGLGRVMPVMLGCYTLVSLALIGIPPASGFISKWYLATGALASGTGAWSWIGPVVLLVSALLTAGYLLVLVIRGFFPGTDYDGDGLKRQGLAGQEPSWLMLAPMMVLTAGAVLFGIFPGPLVSMLESIAAAVLGRV